MRVIGTVAAHAVSPEFLSFYGRCVTGVTVDFGVCSHEREFRVIVAAHPPQVVTVTIPARDAETALMAIVSLVTTDAALRNGGVQVPTAMTIGAPNMGMAPKEGETSLTGVVELLRIPVGAGMAVAALLALVAFVNVVRRMATDTFRWHVLISFADVTCRAGCFHVLAGQGKGRLVMVEVRALPGFCVVTGGAIRAQRATMGVVLGMTAATNRRRLAIGLAHGPSGHAGLVTATAG